MGTETTVTPNAPKKAAHLAAWRAGLTPEQKAAWAKSIGEGRRNKGRGRVMTRKDVNGIRVSISAVRNGKYLEGTSRTIVVDAVTWETDAVQKLIAGALSKAKTSGRLSTRKVSPVIVV